MKVEVIKPVTLTLKVGSVVEIDDATALKIKQYVKVIEEKEKATKKKKGE